MKYTAQFNHHLVALTKYTDIASVYLRSDGKFRRLFCSAARMKFGREILLSAKQHNSQYVVEYYHGRLRRTSGPTGTAFMSALQSLGYEP